MSLSMYRKQVHARIGTQGGPFDPDALLGANGGVIMFEPATMDFEVEQHERRPIRQSIGQLASIPGNIQGVLRLSTELKGSGTPGTPPRWATLAKAAGFAELIETGTASVGTVRRTTGKAGGTDIEPVVSGTYTGTKNGKFRGRIKSFVTDTSAVLAWWFYPDDGTAATYVETTHTDGDPETLASGLSVAIENPDTSTDGWQVGDEWFFSVVSDQSERTLLRLTSALGSVPFLDMAMFEDGRVKKLHSCQAALMRLSLPVGQPGMIEFEFRGVKAEDPVDASIPTGAPFDETVVPVVRGVQATFDGDAMSCWANLTISIENQLAGRICHESPTGFDAFKIVRRAVNGEVDPEARLIAEANPWPMLFNGTQHELIVAAGSEAGNRYTIGARKVQIASIQQGDRDGLILDSQSLRFCEPEFDEDGEYHELEIVLD